MFALPRFQVNLLLKKYGFLLVLTTHHFVLNFTPLFISAIVLPRPLFASEGFSFNHSTTLRARQLQNFFLMPQALNYTDDSAHPSNSLRLP